MTSRAESAARTREELLGAAGDLLDAGGPDAVTLRAVGAAAGVSRGAPYGHFADKQHLLTVLGAQAWDQLTEDLQSLRSRSQHSPHEQLVQALSALVALGTHRRHRYALMFTRPTSHPEVLLEAAGRAQDGFIDLVAEVMGDAGADPRQRGALLLAGAHGIAGMQAGGHLGTAKWATSAEQLVDLLVARVAAG